MEYKFNLKDKVKVKGTEYSGRILDRSFGFVSLADGFLAKRYTLMLEKEEVLWMGTETMDLAKVGPYPERKLEKIASTEKEKNSLFDCR